MRQTITLLTALLIASAAQAGRIGLQDDYGTGWSGGIHNGHYRGSSRGGSRIDVGNDNDDPVSQRDDGVPPVDYSDFPKPPPQVHSVIPYFLVTPEQVNTVVSQFKAPPAECDGIIYWREEFKDPIYSPTNKVFMRMDVGIQYMDANDLTIRTQWGRPDGKNDLFPFGVGGRNSLDIPMECVDMSDTIDVEAEPNNRFQCRNTPIMMPKKEGGKIVLEYYMWDSQAVAWQVYRHCAKLHDPQSHPSHYE